MTLLLLHLHARPILARRQNVRGLRRKLLDLRISLPACDSDVVVLTETWLDGSIPSALLCDRDASNSRRSRGGGVLIACTNHVASCSVALGGHSLEMLWVRVRLGRETLFIGAVYLPPDRSSSAPDLEKINEYSSLIVERMGPHDHMLLLGDFNQLSITWLPAGLTYTASGFRGNGLP
ncbi:hypothetical protein AND_000191 [Anopheles darlingi]|uniref:Endonuclease/exonuclease/phosphatase domain-containing protein n=1 Tax=Anopheles darlingi TaxID=43151 RepID=W5JWH0_ANODA|nr:hypothetical protein AND_000191 [Anopheles darlingi]